MTATARVTSVDYGKLIGATVRPTYAMDIYMSEATRDSFPKKNHINLSGGGYEVVWLNGPWAGLECDIQQIKLRTVTAKIFCDDQIVGHVLLKQYKNATGSDLDLMDFHFWCDYASCEDEQVATAVDQLRDISLNSEGYLEDGEIVTEIAMLNIHQKFVHQNMWAEAILKLMTHCFKSSVAKFFVLKALPLEFMWAIDMTNEADRSNHAKDFGIKTVAGEKRMLRRAKALAKLYQQHLGFAELYQDGSAIWMGRLI